MEEVLERGDHGGFAAVLKQQTIIADAVLLATGADDVQPPIADLAGAIRGGIVRHCPTCDAYEVRDRRIAILGAGVSRAGSDASALLYRRPDRAKPEPAARIAENEGAALQAAGIDLVDEPVAELVAEAKGVCARLAPGGREVGFDTLYVALGLRGRSELATRLGAEHDLEAC